MDGFVYLLGGLIWIGIAGLVLVVFLKRRNRPTCPSCGLSVDRGLGTCPFCHASMG